MSNKQEKPITNTLIIATLLTIPALIIYYIPFSRPTPPNVTKTINLIDPTGTKVQTWNYTGLPISVNYQDPKGVGTLLTTNGLQVILDDQPVYIPVGWYLQIKEPTNEPRQ